MLDQLNEDTIAVVVPAMPQSRRILVGGYSVIDGVALINTPVAQDVRTPVKEKLHTKTSCRPDQKKGRTGYIRSGSERKRRNQRSSY